MIGHPFGYQLVNVNAFRKKVIGKPCEREAHARFDEGELEIGQNYSVTASALYSTVIYKK